MSDHVTLLSDLRNEYQISKPNIWRHDERRDAETLGHHVLAELPSVLLFLRIALSSFLYSSLRTLTTSSDIGFNTPTLQDLNECTQTSFLLTHMMGGRIAKGSFVQVNNAKENKRQHRSIVWILLILAKVSL